MRFPVFRGGYWILFFFFILALVAYNVYSILYNYYKDQSEFSNMLASAPPLKANLTIPKEDLAIANIYTRGHQAVGNRICKYYGENMVILVAVVSSARNLKQRMVIRKTWGLCAKRKDVGLAFVIGKTTNETIMDELTIYQDLIITNNAENEYELLLSISVLEYVKFGCHKVNFLLKTTDRAYINMALLYPLLDYSLSNAGIVGRYLKNVKVSRDRASQYYASPKVYPDEIFPNFISGSTYAVPSKEAIAMYERAAHEMYIQDEGVLLNGIVADKIGIKRTHMKEFSTVDDRDILKRDYSRMVYIPLPKLESFYNTWMLLSGTLLDY